jgi:hypothetical protein
MKLTNDEAYEQICYYTLSLQDEDFIHQNVFDAFAAQTTTDADKPIKLFFALVGLYLYVEKGFNGRRVQRVHMEIARSASNWPRFELPENRGSVTALDVVRADPGAERDQMIDRWCRAVWGEYAKTRPIIETFLKDKGVIE